MKNTRLILIALFALGIGFFSCSSDDDSDAPGPSANIKLKKISNYKGNRQLLFSYDDSNRLKSIEYNRETDSKGGISNKKSDYTYFNGLLVSITESKDNKTIGEKKFVYDENNVLKQIESSGTRTCKIDFEEGNSTCKSTTSFERYNNGSIEKAIIKDSSIYSIGNSPIRVTTNEYQYDGEGHIISVTEEISEVGVSLNTIRHEYEYDDKQNPLPENSYFSDILYSGSYIYLKPQNNIVEEITKYEDSSFDKTTYKYEYNDQGYPISVKITEEEDVPTTITYEYK